MSHESASDGQDCNQQGLYHPDEVRAVDIIDPRYDVFVIRDRHSRIDVGSNHAEIRVVHDDGRRREVYWHTFCPREVGEDTDQIRIESITGARHSDILNREITQAQVRLPPFIRL